MKLNLIIILLLGLFVIIGCKSEEPKIEHKPITKQQNVPPAQKKEPIQLTKQANIDPKVEAEIIAVIKENLAATAAKDKERVLKTIHSTSPQLGSTVRGMDYVFANFDMEFNLEEIDVLEVVGDEAKVYYVQTTRAIKGEGFAPTRATGIHILKKENGKWKIYKTEYLDNQQIM
jgi:PBP1b-binding outer membrane lipoprotein LpoB